jgi:hypothetical protein
MVVLQGELETEKPCGPVLETMNEEAHCRVGYCIYWNNYCPQDLVGMVFSRAALDGQI